MDTYSIILGMHITAGFTALFVAPVAMAVKKGSKTHRLWGKTYFWAMLGVFITSCIMSVMKQNIFLGMVGVFSFYHVATGYRSIYRKKANGLKDIKFVDWVIISLSGLFSLGLVVLGALVLIKNHWHGLGLVALVLGLIGVRSSVLDVVFYMRKDYHKENWMYNHMSGMIGGYIATLSAFSAVNFTFLPDAIRWLWPTVIGVPLLIIWIRKYKNKKKPAKEVQVFQ